MPYPGEQARLTPDKPAAIDAGSGDVLTYRELDDRSRRFANWLHGRGLQRGDHFALFMDNSLDFFVVAWAALRAGLYLTPVNRHLTGPEAGYIVDDCDAQVTVAAASLAAVAAQLPPLAPRCRHWLAAGGPIPGYDRFEDATAAASPAPLSREWLGDGMLYSSGTTGRPKGIRKPLRDIGPAEGFRAEETVAHYRFDEDTVYLSPAPLYHAAPFTFSLGVQWRGGTVVVLPRFDAYLALAAMARHRVTHAQFVPTMFVRMLKLPDAQRLGHDLSALRCAIHAAAPCPPDVKHAMIAWWGPIVEEYYAATEGNGATRIGSAEWLARPGTVGRAAAGILRICDEATGEELPAGSPGLIYFERPETDFAYHKDPARTAGARHPSQPTWSTLGDIGYVDADGYLFLTDRQAFMIIAGGVNIYPREIEDVLIGHPAVRDVAVFGIPDAELGEQVKAVVEPMDGVAPDDATARALLEYAATRLARFKLPRSVDFVAELPRLPTGKLAKHALKRQYMPS